MCLRCNRSPDCNSRICCRIVVLGDVIIIAVDIIVMVCGITVLSRVIIFVGIIVIVVSIVWDVLGVVITQCRNCDRSHCIYISS